VVVLSLLAAANASGRPSRHHHREEASNNDSAKAAYMDSLRAAMLLALPPTTAPDSGKMAAPVDTVKPAASVVTDNDESDSLDTAELTASDSVAASQTGGYKPKAGWVYEHKVKGKLHELQLEIARWLGTPYRYHHAERRVGTDCSGYVKAVMKGVYDLDLPRSAHEMFQIGLEVARDSLQFGDLVFFNTAGKGITHVGIFLGAGFFSHASSRFGVQNYILDDPYYWAKRYRGARRY